MRSPTDLLTDSRDRSGAQRRQGPRCDAGAAPDAAGRLAGAGAPGPGNGAAAARQALEVAHHLAVIDGPDRGLVVPVVNGAVLGRGAVLCDPSLSRHHLDLRVRGNRVLIGAGSARNGATLLRRWRPRRRLRSTPIRLTAGDRVRAGSTLLELRARPSALGVRAPRQPSAGLGAWLAPVLGTVALLAVAGVAVVGVVSGSRSALGAVMVAPMLLMALTRLMPRGGSSRNRRSGPGAGWCGTRPDPASMLLAVAAAVERGPRARLVGRSREESLRAWVGHRRRRDLLSLAPGDAIALAGEHAEDALVWWAAQVVAQGRAAVRAHAGVLTVTWPEDGGTASLSSAGGGAGPGASDVRVLAGSGLDLTAPWVSALSALAGLGPTPEHRGTPQGPPERVRLTEVVGEIDRERLTRRWDAAREGRDALPAILGIGAPALEGTTPARSRVDADLVSDGPHALVAGTTGSGKSELLTSWVLQLCLARPPEQLGLVLVDYKGGAAFGPLAGLPHTAGVLTDLEPASTWRALSSLRAELRRREVLLAEHGAHDVRGLQAAVRPPRLVVVVDEFATLAAEHPDVLDALVRVAAQGRSLGVHLILATQRPQGAVTPAVRANTALRVCLRVLESADSRDVLGHGGAADLERVPGRLLVAGPEGAGSLGAAQAPWAGDRRDLARAVREITAAARGRARPFRPWAEPLPVRARRAKPVRGENRRGRSVLLAVTDLPEEQRLGRWSWDPASPLLVLGSAGSGRTSAAESAARGCCDRGRAAHLCGASWESAGAAAWSPGTVVGPGDPRRLARLWRLALDGALAGDVLVLDDVEALVVAVDEQLGPGEGQALLDALVRGLPALGTSLVVTATLGAATSRWAARLPTRLVLGAAEPAQASIAGLPRGVVTGHEPGRGVLLASGGATACQVVLAATCERWRPRVGAREEHEVVRLEVLPRSVPAGAWAVGGDRAQCPPVPEGSVLVVGPSGSGRSTALRVLARALGSRGAAPADDADGAKGTSNAVGTGLVDGQGREKGQGRDDRASQADGASEVNGAGHGGAAPLVVDDLDLAAPERQQEVEAALAAGRTVLASATTERCATAYRGPLATLRERAALLVLRPGSGPAAQVAGTALRAVTDVRAPTAPGRGALVRHGVAVAIQVAHR